MNKEFEDNEYKLIDLNLGFENLMAISFEEMVRGFKIEPYPVPNVRPNPIDIYMENLAKIVHRDYITPIVEDEIDCNLIPTYCYSRKYFQNSTLDFHRDKNSCEISISFSIAGPEWKIYMSDNIITTKIGNAVIYKGNKITHGRPIPASGEIMQVFCHWVISGGRYEKLAYEANPNNKDFYETLL